MGVGRAMRWAQHITTAHLVEQFSLFGMKKFIGHLLDQQSRLRWLNHLAEISDNHTPKCPLFGWLP